MNDDLRHELEALIPELEASTLLDGAARKRERSRRLMAAGAAALAALALIPVVTGIGSWSRSTPATQVTRAEETQPPGPESERTIRVPIPEPVVEETRHDSLDMATILHPGGFLMSEPCQEAMGSNLNRIEIPAEGLPEGAARVWLCGEISSDAKRWMGPREPLVARAGEATAAINALPVKRESCHGQPGERYAVVLEYPQGTRVVEAYSLLCSSVGGTRSGGPELLRQLVAMFEAERAERGESPVVPPTCDLNPWYGGWFMGFHPLLPMDVTDVTSGTLCGVTADSDGGYRATEIPAEIITAIREGNWVPAPTTEVLDSRGALLLANRFGDVIPVHRTARGELQLVVGERQWTPDPATAEWLRTRFRSFWGGIPGVVDACHGTPVSVDVDVTAIVSAHVCGDKVYNDGTSGWGAYTLPQDLTHDVAEGFRTQAVPGASEALEATLERTALLLVDSSGVGLVLVPGPDHTLVDIHGERTWQVPEHLVVRLAARGLSFP